MSLISFPTVVLGVVKRFIVAYILSLGCVIFSSSFAYASVWLDEVKELIKTDLNRPDIDLELHFDAKKIAIINAKEENIQDVELDRPATVLKAGSVKVIVTFLDHSIIPLLGRYESYILAPAATRFIKAGEILTANDFVPTRARIATNQAFAPLEEIIGKQAKISINSGSLIKASSLTMPVIVHTNDVVHIQYNSGPLQIKTTAIALQNGSIGEVISVKNQKTGAVLSGMVVNSDTVEVSK